MRHVFAADQLEYRRRVDPAQAHVGARLQRHRPRKAPAIAVEHRQRPQIDREVRHAPGDHVADGVQVRPAMVQHYAFGVAGRPGGVVQRDRIPLVVRPAPGELGVTARQECFVRHFPQQLAARSQRVVDVDHQRFAFHSLQRLAHQRRELPVGDQHLGLAMLEHEGDSCRIQTGIKCIEHHADHRNSEVRLEERRDVGRQNGDGVPSPDAAHGQCRSEPAATLVGFAPGLAVAAMHDCEALRMDQGGTAQERRRRKWSEVGRILVQAQVVGIGSGHRVAPACSAHSQCVACGGHAGVFFALCEAIGPPGPMILDETILGAALGDRPGLPLSC